MSRSGERVAAMLRPLTNYERTRPDAVRWSLDAMLRLLARPGARHPARARLVQVGGSKGKGTTSTYLGALARASGRRDGIYLSPHVSSLLERVQIGGRDVSEDRLVAELEPVLDFARGAGLSISFFEAMTAAALGCFADADVELAVLEVGLGGRLDATTAVPVDASILTGVELEHTELLGDTVEAIATEKVAIVRPGRPAFVALDGPALAIARARALEVGGRLEVAGEDFGADAVELGPDERAVRLWRRDGGTRREHEMILRGAPRHEVRALALAWVCLERIWPGCLEPVTALDRPRLPGRFEVSTEADGHPLVLDGAHTQQSANVLATELRARWPGARFAVLFASARGKRWREVLSELRQIADSFVVTGLSDTPSEDPETIRSWLAQRGSEVRAVPDAAAGLRALRAHRGVRVVTGSFYLVGAVRELVASQAAP